MLCNLPTFDASLAGWRAARVNGVPARLPALEPARGERLAQPVVDDPAQACCDRSRVRMLAKSDGDLLGANFAQKHVDAGLVPGKVEHESGAADAPHPWPTSRSWSSQRSFAGNLQIVEALPNRRRVGISDGDRLHVPAHLRLAQ